MRHFCGKAEKRKVTIMSLAEYNKKTLSKLLVSRLSEKDVQRWLNDYSTPYKKLMSYYKCAIMEVQTKFNVLNEEMSLEYDRNPIETIKSRLKSPESIIDKLNRKNIALTVEDIEENINDIAGIRVICSYITDIYMLAEAFLKQDDITLIEKKDYIQSPKDNGYRSLHLIVQIPIFLRDKKKLMKVEVQLRTISMDWWASLEHKICYKKGLECYDELRRELRECADIASGIDEKMEMLQRKSDRARETDVK